MVEPIEMPFGLWARMGPRNHVLDGSADLLRDVAMATNFRTQFAITDFLAFDGLKYTFGCMIASDALFTVRRNPPQCKRCTSYSNSVRLSVTRRYCVKTTARSTVQFALSDSKMCLVL